MFMARVKGTVVATVKHSTLQGCRFLLVQRVEADGALAEEPNLVVDWQGAANGSTVIVSTDGDISRAKFGNNTPARMVVMGIVDDVSAPASTAMVNA
jgi:ethanolamine utilization protein EutN